MTPDAGGPKLAKEKEVAMSDKFEELARQMVEELRRSVTSTAQPPEQQAPIEAPSVPKAFVAVCPQCGKRYERDDASPSTHYTCTQCHYNKVRYRRNTPYGTTKDLLDSDSLWALWWGLTWRNAVVFGGGLFLLWLVMAAASP
jgi:predicted RNA-binding Zn-ribbon protein involved in translation (DUF1610 family)